MKTHYQALTRRVNTLKERISPTPQPVDRLVIVYYPYIDGEEVDPADNPKLTVREPGFLLISYRAHTEEEHAEIEAKARVLIDAYKQGLVRNEVKR